MERKDIFEKLNLVFRGFFEDASIVLNENTSAEDIEGWDSFEHVNLIIAIEKEFGIKIPMGKVGTLENVGDIVNIIMEMSK